VTRPDTVTRTGGYVVVGTGVNVGVAYGVALSDFVGVTVAELVVAGGTDGPPFAGGPTLASVAGVVIAADGLALGRACAAERSRALRSSPPTSTLAITTSAATKARADHARMPARFIVLFHTTLVMTVAFHDSAGES
jgi:hypothetical protein